MRKCILNCIVILTLLSCIGCSQTTQSSNQSESQTGSFDNVSISYNAGYKVEFHTQSSGHPNPDADFFTTMSWENEQGSYSCSINYYGIEDNADNNYKDYDKLEEVTVNSKDYKLKDFDGILNLIYKVDDNFYLNVEIYDLYQYDKNGNSVQTSYKLYDALQDGVFDNEIDFDVYSADNN